MINLIVLFHIYQDAFQIENEIDRLVGLINRLESSVNSIERKSEERDLIRLMAEFRTKNPKIMTICFMVCLPVCNLSEYYKKVRPYSNLCDIINS